MDWRDHACYRLWMEGRSFPEGQWEEASADSMLRKAAAKQKAHSSSWASRILDADDHGLGFGNLSQIGGVYSVLSV